MMMAPKIKSKTKARLDPRNAQVELFEHILASGAPGEHRQFNFCDRCLQLPPVRFGVIETLCLSSSFQLSSLWIADQQTLVKDGVVWKEVGQRCVNTERDCLDYPMKKVVSPISPLIAIIAHITEDQQHASEPGAVYMQGLGNNATHNPSAQYENLPVARPVQAQSVAVAPTPPVYNSTTTPSTNRQQAPEVYLDKNQRIRRTFTHNVSLLLNLVTCGAALNIALGQVLGMVMQSVGWVEFVVRIYEIFFSLLVILNELQWTKVIQESPVLSSFTYRGILYTFVGILGVMMNDIGMNAYRQSQWSEYGSYANNNITIYIPTQEQALELYIRVVSWSMVVFGVIYTAMGLLRVQEKVERHKEEYKMRLSHAGQANDKNLSMCGVMA